MTRDPDDDNQHDANQPIGDLEFSSLCKEQLDEDCIAANEQLDKELRQLIHEACQHSERSSERRRLANRIIYKMQQSGQIKLQGSDHYEEALQQTWIWFGKKICEFDPEKARNPEASTVIGWFKSTLRLRVRHRSNPAPPPLSTSQPFSDESKTTLEDSLEGKEPSPEEFAEARELLEKIRTWLQAEKQKKKLQRMHVPKHAEANCYELAMKRLPTWDDQSQQFLDGKTWEQIVQELDVLDGEDREQLLRRVRRFYRNRCLRCLRDFLED